MSDAPLTGARAEQVPPDASANRLSVRTALAAAAGKLAARVSRAVRVGQGGMIGGRVTLALQPQALRELSQGRSVVLVSATNGKTTTTRMLAHALGTLGPVASNDGGANMPDGLVAALTEHRHAPYAVLEIDETHLPGVLEYLTPAAIVLLNLSRDQMDRVGEVRRTERIWRAALARCQSTTVVANCDDVLVASAALDAANTVWASVGSKWRGDAGACPRCGSRVRHDDQDWSCECGLTRPRPSWVLDKNTLHTPDGETIELTLGVPGPANAANAAMAIAATALLGVPARRSAERIATVTEVQGRYRVATYRDRAVRTLLAKNPAGWAETLRVLRESTSPIVLSLNAREADGRDPSWLWDVRFEQLRGRRVIVSGERAADLAVRLTYAEVAYSVAEDPLAAITEAPPGPVDVVANYTAFRDLTRRLDNAR